MNRLRLLTIVSPLVALVAPAAASRTSTSPTTLRAPPRATAAKNGARRHRAPPKVWAPVTLEHVTTHEQFNLCPDAKGRLGNQQLNGITSFLRCHHTGKRHAMAPRLPQIMYAVAQHFKAGRIEIIAGYRAPRIARAKGNPRSHHKQGRACDFRVEGVALTALRDYVKQSFDRVGVGYYPNAGFIHVDVQRQKSAYWVDYSRPGEPARYRPLDEADETSLAVAPAADDDRMAPPERVPGLAPPLAPPAE